MNNLQIFTFQQNEVRMVMQNDEPWWVLKDVCDVLEIGDVRRVAERIDEDELTGVRLHSGGQMREMYAVNEPGLYNVILRSDKPEAKAFKRWVTHEVLPSIRRHGLYAAEDLLANPDLLIQAATALKDERAKNAALSAAMAVQKQQIAELKPKATYYDLILQCTGLTAITVIAKDYGKSGVWFNNYLHEIGIQYKVGDVWVLYQKYAECGYTQTKTHNYTDHKTGKPGAKPHTYWTQKGRLFLYEILKSHGVLPRIESDKNAKAVQDFEEDGYDGFSN